MQTITIEPVLPEAMDEVLRLWDHEVVYQDALWEENSDNPFAGYLRSNGEPRPIWSILSIIRHRYHGFGILERPYLDLEFWDSHSGFYNTCFSKIDRDCERFHFFEPLDKDADIPALVKDIIERLQAGETEKEILKKAKYLGYSVFRPIPSNVVGRTAILFDPRSKKQLEDANLGHLQKEWGRPVLKATQKRYVTLLNAQFFLESPEFIQQDPQLGQCATASLWVAGNISAKKFGTRQVRFPTITKNAMGPKLPNIATAYISGDPNLGLSPPDIKNSLASIGTTYQSERDKKDTGMSSVETAVRLSHFVYSYVESGLPVILCLDALGQTAGHAVAAIGHFLPSKLDKGSIKIISLDAATGNEDHVHHATVSTMTDIYYVHDDCNGPFNKLHMTIVEESPQKCPHATAKPSRSVLRCTLGDVKLNAAKPASSVKEDATGLAEEQPDTSADKAGLEQETTEYNLREAIVPVHFRVRHSAWDSLLKAIDLCGEWYEFEQDELLLWRSFLVSGSDFKRSLHRRGYGKKTIAFYANQHMPKYVWVHEFTQTTKDSIGSCFPDGKTRKVDGEFIMDATTAKHDIRLISARMGQVLNVPGLEPDFDEDCDGVPCFIHQYGSGNSCPDE